MRPRRRLLAWASTLTARPSFWSLGRRGRWRWGGRLGGRRFEFGIERSGLGGNRTLRRAQFRWRRACTEREWARWQLRRRRSDVTESSAGASACKRARDCLDHRAARDGAQEVVTAANPPRTSRANCCVKNERRCRFLGWGRLRFLPVRPTPRDSARSARASPPRPSQEPLDGRKRATFAALVPRGALGRMPPDSSDRLQDFRGGLTRGSVRAKAFPWP